MEVVQKDLLQVEQEIHLLLVLLKEMLVVIQQQVHQLMTEVVAVELQIKEKL